MLEALAREGFPLLYGGSVKPDIHKLRCFRSRIRRRPRGGRSQTLRRSTPLRAGSKRMNMETLELVLEFLLVLDALALIGLVLLQQVGARAWARPSAAVRQP